MKLERIKIEGYRSLKSVEWKPEALNVLIGANASGKSNFLQALELLPAAADGRLKETIFNHGGMAPLMWDGNASEFGIEARLTSLTYNLRLRRLEKSGSYEITSEDIISPASHLGLEDFPGKRSTMEAALSQRFQEPRMDALVDCFSRWSIHQDLRTDQRAPVRESAVTSFAKRLERDGQNLIPVLHTLYTGDRGFEEDVDKTMSAAFPGEYEKLSFQSVPERGRITMAIRWKRGRWQPTTAELSDGTLRFLMLVAALATPEPPPLIAIDEPETGLHPGMLTLVAELAQQAATKSTVILSTHSPEFLDAFEEEDLPATTVFEWKGGQTVLRTLAGDELKNWVEDYSLGKFAFSGEAEALL